MFEYFYFLQEVVVCSFVSNVALQHLWMGGRDRKNNAEKLSNYKVGELLDVRAVDSYSLSSDKSLDDDC